MTRILLPLVILSVLSGAICAQAPAPAPEEMKKFDRIVGDWSGKGTSSDGQGNDMNWTSRNSARKVMGGHFVRDVVEIKFEAPFELTLGFVNYYAWDATQKRYLAYSINNMGILRVTEVEWKSDDVMIQKSVSDHPAMGRSLERWTTTFKKDGTVHLHGQSAGDTGAFYDMVDGVMTRQKNATPVALEQIGAFAMPGMPGAPAEMKKLLRMAGTYRVEGKYAMAPGQPFQEFVGTETITSAFGGYAMINRPSGEGYEGFAIAAWDAGRHCYTRYYVNSWGMHHADEFVWMGDRLVFQSQQEMMGSRMISRYILDVDEEGKLVKGIGHTITGTADPFVSFESKYTQRNDAGN